MGPWDLVGYAASALVLAAFYMKGMLQLRVVALCSNIAFLLYGCALDLTPICVLHTLLLPLNGWRLVEALRCSPATRPLRTRRRRPPLPARGLDPAPQIPTVVAS